MQLVRASSKYSTCRQQSRVPDRLVTNMNACSDGFTSRPYCSYVTLPFELSQQFWRYLASLRKPRPCSKFRALACCHYCTQSQGVFKGFAFHDSIDDAGDESISCPSSVYDFGRLHWRCQANIHLHSAEPGIRPAGGTRFMAQVALSNVN